jgi:hypothetical protein
MELQSVNHASSASPTSVIIPNEAQRNKSLSKVEKLESKYCMNSKMLDKPNETIRNYRFNIENRSGKTTKTAGGLTYSQYGSIVWRPLQRSAKRRPGFELFPKRSKASCTMESGYSAVIGRQAGVQSSA